MQMEIYAKEFGVQDLYIKQRQIVYNCVHATLMEDSHPYMVKVIQYNVSIYNVHLEPLLTIYGMFFISS